MCQISDYNGKIGDYGIITSFNYPNWSPNEDCTRIIRAPTGYIVRVYVNDYSIEDRNLQNGL